MMETGRGLPLSIEWTAETARRSSGVLPEIRKDAGASFVLYAIYQALMPCGFCPGRILHRPGTDSGLEYLPGRGLLSQELYA